MEMNEKFLEFDWRLGVEMEVELDVSREHL